MGTNEENIIENFVCFIYGGAGSQSRTLASAPTKKYRLQLCNTWLRLLPVLILTGFLPFPFENLIIIFKNVFFWHFLHFFYRKYSFDAFTHSFLICYIVKILSVKHSKN